MTIEFNCPNCNEVIAFSEKHSGKNAHCTSCGQHFVIPSKSFEKARIVKPAEEVSAPVEGFYKAVFIENLKLFIKPQNTTGLVFVIAAVCFKFFTGHVDYSWQVGGFRFIAPLGLIITLACWGCLFWFYMEMIRMTALDFDEMPDIDMGGFFGFIWNVVKSLYIFSVVFVMVELPCIFSITFLGQNNILSILLSIIGFSLFPVAILTVSAVGDITSLFQPSHIFKPVARAFWPYFTVAVLFILTCQLELITIDYGKLIGAGKLVIGLNLFANLAVQMLAIITMRSIGLFYRHYGCYFKW
jgi:ribosomal protein S27E